MTLVTELNRRDGILTERRRDDVAAEQHQRAGGAETSNCAHKASRTADRFLVAGLDVVAVVEVQNAKTALGTHC